jgi:hypothetical protein
MKRFLLFVCVIGILNALAVPALAQRDPFDPLVTQSSGDTTTTAPDTSGSTNDSEPTDPAVDDSSLAATGSTPTPWFAIAYVLIAVGAGLVVMGRVGAPAMDRTKKR